jgi:hypothetical protein
MADWAQRNFVKIVAAAYCLAVAVAVIVLKLA